MELFRESIVGQLIRYITKNRVLKYPEEQNGFHWAPLDRILAQDVEKDEGINGAPQPHTTSSTPRDLAETGAKEKPDEDAESSMADNDHDDHEVAEPTLTRTLTRTSTRPYTPERFDVEEALKAQRTKSIVLAPTKTADGTILVDWYTTDDPANPQNWTATKKRISLALLCSYSFAAYGASSMYVTSTEGVMSRFHVGPTPAALGLALYVVGYGVGPLLFAPLSEIASIGRNWVYGPTFFLFVILGIPLAVVQNFAGLLVLRFLTGFFSSPAVANGGASIGDMYSFLELPIYLSGWTVACFWGPALGPVITGFAVQAKGWRWGLWEIVWLSAPILVAFLLFYPETSAENILRRRAHRLRKLTGRSNIKSKSEIDQENLKASEVFSDAMIKPIEIFIKDPAVMFTNIYISLTYGIYYSFFEVFPLVYPLIYNFNLGETGLTFLVIGPACVVGVTSYLVYQIWYLIPDIKKNGLKAPEHRLVPALVGVIFLPAGYFMFGWTARPEVHWIVGLIGVGILVTSNFLIFQSVFIYLPLSYPKYAASLFAANDLSRSLFAAACVLFSRPMFLNLGIGGGVSLLAGLSCLGVLGMFYLWKYGGWLRSKSKFATS